MTFTCSTSSVVALPYISQFESFHSLSKNVLIPFPPAIHLKSQAFSSNDVKTCRSRTFSLFSFERNRIQAIWQCLTNTSTISLDWEDHEDVEDAGSPWEGAVVYKRNPTETHIERCTTLERLGLGKLSTEVSKSTASVLGMRVTKSVKDYPQGTPVLISMDVIRKKQKLRIDGIVRTVLTLGCNRCGDPAAQSVFSNFSLLLTEEPIEEPDVIDLGSSFGKEPFKSSECSDDEDDDIDWEDRLYFPVEAKEIDVSKHIRDLIHLEITINAVCDPNCKGMCLQCGKNLNTQHCSCSREESKRKGYGPLGDLRKRMQQKIV